MIEDIQIRHLSAHTQRAYLETVARFAKHFGRSPRHWAPSRFARTRCLLQETQERKLAPSSLGIAACGLRFLYKVTLKRPWQWDTVIPAPKKPMILPAVLSPDEVVHFLACVPQPAHRTILATCYATGLRISEAVALTVAAIDSQRMVLRVDDGKGHQDRCVMPSPTLLTLLREWWRVHRPPHWLFPGKHPGRHLTSHAVREAAQRAHQRSRIAKPIHPHSLRHAFAVQRGTDIRTIQLLLGHRRLETTARYLRLATTPVCATVSPLDLLRGRAPSTACRRPPSESGPSIARR